MLVSWSINTKDEREASNLQGFDSHFFWPLLWASLCAYLVFFIMRAIMALPLFCLFLCLSANDWWGDWWFPFIHPYDNSRATCGALASQHGKSCRMVSSPIVPWMAVKSFRVWWRAGAYPALRTAPSASMISCSMCVWVGVCALGNSPMPLSFFYLSLYLVYLCPPVPPFQWRSSFALCFPSSAGTLTQTFGPVSMMCVKNWMHAWLKWSCLLSKRRPPTHTSIPHRWDSRGLEELGNVKWVHRMNSNGEVFVFKISTLHVSFSLLPYSAFVRWNREPRRTSVWKRWRGLMLMCPLALSYLYFSCPLVHIHTIALIMDSLTLSLFFVGNPNPT